MGTHNLLLRLGDELFLEVIAADPSVPPPSRPRWFALDALAADTPPRLSNWVARTADIHATLAHSQEDLGKIEPMSRGDNHWLITIPEDGSLPLEGVAPALIEWHTARHPAQGMPQQGLALLKLELHHPDAARLARLMQSLQMQAGIVVHAIAAHQSPRLIAHIHTPAGVCILS
ncbi:VOC family protein [Undibacterium sp. Ji49W]|uniref:VOC family protein n=1 Tax=Undibacterium sp. Ji49W TaxID=3413040 RepID=UPI003BF10836